MRPGRARRTTAPPWARRPPRPRSEGPAAPPADRGIRPEPPRHDDAPPPPGARPARMRVPASRPMRPTPMASAAVAKLSAAVNAVGGRPSAVCRWTGLRSGHGRRRPGSWTVAMALIRSDDDDTAMTPLQRTRPRRAQVPSWGRPPGPRSGRPPAHRPKVNRPGTAVASGRRSVEGPRKGEEVRPWAAPPTCFRRPAAPRARLPARARRSGATLRRPQHPFVVDRGDIAPEAELSGGAISTVNAGDRKSVV